MLEPRVKQAVGELEREQFAVSERARMQEEKLSQLKANYSREEGWAQ